MGFYASRQHPGQIQIDPVRRGASASGGIPRSVYNYDQRLENGNRKQTPTGPVP